MPIPDWTPADFAAGMQALLPRGRAWPRDPNAVQSQVIAALSPTAQRLAEAGAEGLAALFPVGLDAMLPEWEASLGLPDPCAGESPTLQQRQAQVLARLTDSGGASVDYFIAYAATLGFDITITQFAPAIAGRLRAGQPALGAAWASTTITYFRAGASTAGEALTEFGNAVLQCEIERLAPAHTTVIFAYA